MAKLLLIEDEAGMRLIVRVNLELSGHELVEAADGAAGLGLALHHTDLAEPAEGSYSDFIAWPSVALLDASS